MADVPYACPFCNAQFDRAQAGPRGWLCPGCQELLPAALQEKLEAPSGSNTYNQPQPSRPARFANWKLAVAVFMSMVVMAMIGLEFALRTIERRRQNDPRLVAPSPPVSSPAASWAGLGYLPSDVNLLAGIQVHAILKDPRSQKILTPPRPALVETFLGRLEKATGLVPSDLDHVVFGMNVDRTMPRLTLVASTRQDFSPEDLAKPLQANRLQNFHGKPFYTFSMQTATGRMWCPEKKVLVLTFGLGDVSAQDLEKLPFPPRSPDELPGLSDILKRRDKSSLVWAGGQGDWQQLANLMALAGIPADSGKLLDVLTKVQGFLAEWIPGETWKFQANLQIPQPEDRILIQKLLKENAPGLRVEMPPPEITGAAAWSILQYRFTESELLDFLNRPKQPKKGK